MPHGGYHGTVKMGGKTVQRSSRPSSRGGQTGGGRYRPQGYDKPKPSSQTAAELTNQIREQMKADPDPRSAYIGAQADSSRLSNLLRQEQQQNLANQVAASFAKGNARKSDFLGHAGDKSFLGLNYGSTPTAAATVINPFTGERIVTNKVREGMTSPEYSKYMQGLYSLNPNKMEELFPFASGKTARTVAQQLMPFGNVFSTIADAYKSGSSKIQGGASAIADGFKGTVDGITGLLPTSLGGSNVPDEFIVQKNKSETVNDSLDEPDFLNEATGDYFDTRKGFGTRMPGVPLIGDGAFNTQNQVDPNNQFDVAELTQKQIDFMRNPMQSLDFQSRESLFNKVKQLEKKGLFGIGAQEPTTREEFEEFINSGGIRQAADGGMIEGGLASINNPDYQRLMGASNFGF